MPSTSVTPLFPYIYTNARKAYDTGLSILRPMYYEYPSENEAYASKNQYFFGDDMIVAPVISPAPEGENQAKVTVWLPKGQWYEWYTGTMLEGGKVYDRSFLIKRNTRLYPIRRYCAHVSENQEPERKS